jgi:hypothetical protein
MKIKNLLTAIICLATASIASAHCPSAFKEEKVCLMLADNMVYIYDHKLEHNGPYKDLEKASVVGIKTLEGKNLEFKKLARGIYKFEAPTKYKNVVLEVTLDKKKKEIQVTHE